MATARGIYRKSSGAAKLALEFAERPEYPEATVTTVTAVTTVGRDMKHHQTLGIA